jgi:hypothetical protein
VLFGETPNQAIDDGLKNQTGSNAKKDIYNINTIGYRDSSLRSSETISALVGRQAFEYVKKMKPDKIGPNGSGTGGIGDGFMAMARADNSLRTMKLVVGVKNAVAVINASLSDASAPAYSKTIQAGSSEEEYIIEIPYRAASDGQHLMARYTIAQALAEDGEVSLKAVMLR